MKKIFVSVFCACLLGSGCVFVVAPGHHPDKDKLSANKIEEHESDLRNRERALDERERDLDRRFQELREHEQSLERHENNR